METVFWGRGGGLGPGRRKESCIDGRYAILHDSKRIKRWKKEINAALPWQRRRHEPPIENWPFDTQATLFLQYYPKNIYLYTSMKH